MPGSNKIADYKEKLHEATHGVAQPLSIAINYIEGSIHYLKKEKASEKILTALEEAVNEIEKAGKLMREHRDSFLKDCEKGK